MRCPDIEPILRPLKPFQLKTVEHAFHRLFTAKDSTARFLVADEVGLGKTLVARGVIARTIEHLWDTVPQIDIVYICSNGSIARSNLPKLHIPIAGEQSYEMATRLTMLATQLATKNKRKSKLANKVNLVSFTPATSFNMGHSTGRWEERQLLYQLLLPVLGKQVALQKMMQVGIVDRAWWRRQLEHHRVPLHRGIAEQFRQAITSDSKFVQRANALLEGPFRKNVDEWSPTVRGKRNTLIADARRLLAQACIHELQPDLVIMDEFQRFKTLMETRTEHQRPEAELAQLLFEASNNGQPVRSLLLSATPYKLVTLNAERKQEDHYEDFLKTTRFLMRDNELKLEKLKSNIRDFSHCLTMASTNETSRVMEAKAKLEESLCTVMARTERVRATSDQDAMVESQRVIVPIKREDVNQYMAMHAFFEAVGDRDPMEYWKSAPYLPNFMRGYTVNQRLEAALTENQAPLNRVLRTHTNSFLRKQSLAQWGTVSLAHAKLRDLAKHLLDNTLWKLLWLPPTTPYWPLKGAFAGQETVGKTLLFSAWNVVPDAVSGLLSYEAERRMMGGQMSRYRKPNEQQARLLNFSLNKKGEPSRFRLFNLMLPCITLADEAHPLTAAPGASRRRHVRNQVKELLADLPNPTDKPIDKRWDWVAPLLLDPGLRTLLEDWRTQSTRTSADNDDVYSDAPQTLLDHIDALLALDTSTLGAQPPGLLNLMTQIALGSPAVLLARSIGGKNIPDRDRRALALHGAQAFWALFNQPAVIKLFEQEFNGGKYWENILRYCENGNLQAVLDEQWHLMWEQHSWSDNMAPTDVARRCVNELHQAIRPIRSSVRTQFFSASKTSVQTSTMDLRTAFALRFGKTRTDKETITADRVRKSFNSPFRPFVLASTSVGQEGLDFHPWCDRLVHWNLPGNPVDLEQREGRINRYKSHAIRKNVAQLYKNKAFKKWQLGDNIWSLVFDEAEQDSRGDSDLIPCWMAPGPHKVKRYVPLLPYSKDVALYERLQRQLATYRVVFGQPRQEELLHLLDQSEIDTETLRSWAIDLSPP